MVADYVVGQMLKDEEGGYWFKLNFMILVEYAFIHTPGDGNLSPQIFDYIADVDMIKNYNWCGYVITKLLETHKRWRNNPTKIFTGPVIFVVACYVDRIVFQRKMVPRCYPTVKGWTAELLKERQRAELSASQFGLGHKYERYVKQPNEVNNEEVESESEHDVPEDVRSLEMNDQDKEGNTSGSQEKTFIDQWKEVAKECIASTWKMLDLLEEAPGEIRNLDSFKIICDTTRTAMGMREESMESVAESQNSRSNAMNNDDIDDPEWIDIMIELTKAAERTYILKNRDEFPTFTLIPEYDQTPDENLNFNLEKDMEKENLPEEEMVNEAAQQEKENVPEKEVELPLNDESEVSFKNDSLST